MRKVSSSTTRRNRFAGFGALLSAVFVLWVPVTPASAVEVGVAAAVNKAAFGTPPGGNRRTKVLGDNVIYNERIETNPGGLVQVLLRDGSTFTVGANSDLVIDEFVYDPNAGTGKLVASFSKGVARFVGGKLSKNRGGVTVKTPVGTIGIRGGIANLNLSGNNQSFSLLFGKELNFIGTNGQHLRVYESGYTLNVNQLGAASIRRTTQADLGQVQDAMTSRNGQHGGASNTPTDGSVSSSDFVNSNSGLGLINTLPRPKPDVVLSTNLSDVDDTLVKVNEVNTENVVTTGTETEQVRALRAGTTYSPSFNSSLVISNPGNQGLIGGPSGTDMSTTFKTGMIISGNAKALYVGSVGNDPVYIFDPNNNGQKFFSQTTTDKGYAFENASSSKVPAVPILDGTTYGNAKTNAQGVLVTGEKFAAAAYFLATGQIGTSNPTFNYGGQDVIYLLYGVGTDFSSFGNASDPVNVRSYKLYSDPLTMFQLGTSNGDGSFQPVSTNALFVNPLVAQDLGASFMSNVSSTGLLMIEDSSTTLDKAKFLASSFRIEGTGSSQKSMISLGVASIFQDNGQLTTSFGRRGSHRTGTTQSSASYGGSVVTEAGTDGGHFFGPNAQNFLLSGDVENADAYSDSYLNLPSGTSTADTISNTVHPGQLQNEYTVSSLSRTTRTLYGYGAGIVESSDNTNPVAFSSSKPDQMMLSFNAGNNSLLSTLSVSDRQGHDSNAESFLVKFGTEADGSGYSRSAFIDDDNYAARDSKTPTDTYMVLNADLGNATVPHVSDSNVNSYLVPSTLVGDADNAIMSGVTECTCAFLEWGYWGTKTKYKNANFSGGERTDYVHLGTWVAGNITNSASLPSTGSATYAGHAVGNVANGSAKYLAAGNFSMSMDFGSRTGSASVSNFDGKNFSATLSETTVSSGNLFNGTVSGALNGEINTSIVSGPSTNYDGAIGNFNVTDGSTWAATGIVAGQKQ
ncbi:FecR domain-containing protein [Roseibium aggregatum]|uniref:FecR protein domain-containing protein n=1 Tax=Roseibium aggregatum TaxID=187304 RepID=A0A926S8C6_9HYPH|nr:FecR domain-containing protein [Roseibium aggregatum]MBD1549340.1 hypothetical protein [Roseibium aggregatum]